MQETGSMKVIEEQITDYIGKESEKQNWSVKRDEFFLKSTQKL